MQTIISKTDYIIYRECPKNAWIRIHKPDIYYKSELSDFEKCIMETGNEVELVARKLFPDGVLVESKGSKAQKITTDYLSKKQSTIFQATFIKDGFLAAVDVMKFNKHSKRYSIYEIKSTNQLKEKTHLYDLAFQVNLLRRCGVDVETINLIHLNPDYVRNDELNLVDLFITEDVNTMVRELLNSVDKEMEQALAYLSDLKEPSGPCCCIYKGRSNHCSTFTYSNPKVPEYSIHDIARIGSSKAKLTELADLGLFHLHEIPDHIKLSEIQKKQVEVFVTDKVHVQINEIAEELKKLIFPLYFLDYETFPCAIPRHDGFSPYQQIPFQYSLHILEAPNKPVTHKDFLYVKSDNPTQAFAKSLQENIGDKGSIIVWNKKFECGINEQLATRLPKVKQFIDSINSRVFDLMDIFFKQYYVHKDFRGSISIKHVLPVLVPDLNYHELAIQEGGTASQRWNEIVSNLVGNDQKKQIANDLKAYCKLDTHAMFAIWEHLYDLTVAKNID